MTKRVSIIGVPMDLGQIHRGVDMGPSAIRYAELATSLRNLGYEVIDAGNINVPVKEHLGGDDDDIRAAIRDVCTAAYKAGRRAIRNRSIPIFLGGDHSIAIGTIAGVCSSRDVGVIWVDAHGDFNLPETSPNGNIHGMPLSVLVGHGHNELVDLVGPGPALKPEDAVLIGIRDLDFDERDLLRKSGIHIFTMRDVDEYGAGEVARRALAALVHKKHLHVSLDMDVIDPHEAPGVGTPAQGGLTQREGHLLMEVFADSNKIVSADLVEINPIRDHHNCTAKMGVDLIASLLGKRIL